MSDCNSLFISQKGIHNICLDANCSPHILPSHEDSLPSLGYCCDSGGCVGGGCHGSDHSGPGLLLLLLQVEKQKNIW